MTDNESVDFSRLMAKSSLGSPGARELISRSDPTEVSRVQQTARKIEARGVEAQEARIEVRHDADFTAHVTFRGDITMSSHNECSAAPIGQPNRQTRAQDLDWGGPSGYALLFESFGGSTACTASGITSSTLDSWTRSGLIEPCLADPARQWMFGDIVRLSVTKRLLDAGLSPHQARPAVRFLGECNTDQLPRVTLMTDGAWVRVCTSGADVIDLLHGGPPVFGIAISGVWREVMAKLLSRACREESRKPTEKRGPEAFLEEAEERFEEAKERFRRASKRLAEQAQELNDYYVSGPGAPTEESPAAGMSTSCSRDRSNSGW